MDDILRLGRLLSFLQRGDWENMPNDDAVVLMANGLPVHARKSILRRASGYFRAVFASLQLDEMPVGVVHLALPELILPPFFNRQSIEIDPVAAFRFYCVNLGEIDTEHFHSVLMQLETRILSCFVIFSHYFSVDYMHSIIDSLLCDRFAHHLCDETLEFARLYQLRILHRRSLAALLRVRSYHIEANYGVSVQEISDAMAPDFFQSISSESVIDLVKFAAMTDYPSDALKSDIYHRRCEIIISDGERLRHLLSWLMNIIDGTVRSVDLLFALDVAHCIRYGRRSQRLPETFLCLLTALIYRRINV